MQLSDKNKIGTGLIVLGFGFMFLGMVLFFDSKLLAMGNMMALFGFITLSGIKRSLEFFGLYGIKAPQRWKDNWRGLGTFYLGIIMIMNGWGAIGIAVELYGGLKLFASFIPLVRNLPAVDSFLQMPGVSWFADKLKTQGKASTSMV